MNEAKPTHLSVHEVHGEYPVANEVEESGEIIGRDEMHT